MREHRFARAKWLLFTICCIVSSITGENATPTWSKPEKSISAENNDWIPVQGKCPTCRPNRDLDAQSTNELINQVLSPPAPQPSRLPGPQPTPKQQQIQFATQKQPRILPFGSSFPPFNNPFFNGDSKPYQLQSTKLFPQEPQKQFYQYDTGSFIKQPYSLPPQQLIQQSPALVQQQISQQRFPGVSEPYPFTLPLKPVETTTPKALYQAKIRFPDGELPKYIPNNKITSQNTEEIQLLYVPVETLQRGRKNMKEQLPPTLQQSFIPPQYNLPYSTFPAAQPESQFYFPQGYSPPPNFIQQQQVPQQQQKSPETIQTNASKNVLQPYFTINSVYNGPPAGLQTLPPKPADLQFINLLQAGLINPNQLKPPEQQFKLPAQVRPGQFEANNLQPEKTFLLQPNPNIQNVQTAFNDVYTPTTTEAIKTQFVTEKSTFASKQPTTKLRDFEYQYVTGSPQTSASQNQQYVFEQNVLNLPKQVSQQLIPQFTQQRIPQTKLPSGFEESNPNYPVPHQPPLSFYMEKLHNSKINDVLYLLKDAKTIPVLDAVENEPPQVFVGPSELQPPKGYIKFELPYLSSLDYNRIDKMIDRLPFFVAPLNFKPPPGYSKIPFPAPHIGSVVLSNSTAVHEALHGKPSEQKYKPTPPPLPSTQFSTTNPQLTSQINSLLDAPSIAPSESLSFKNSFSPSPPGIFEQTFKPFSTPAEEVTKKPLVPTKITYRPPITTTEQPKRVINRQRKPIYRGYPTTTSTTTEQSTTQFSTTPEPAIRKVPESVKDTDNYVEFAAKGNFNFNDGSQVPAKPIPTSDNTYQQQVQQPSTSFQPPFDSDKTFDISNFFSTFGNQQPLKQNIQFSAPDFQNAPAPQNSKQFHEVNPQFQNTQFQNPPQPSSPQQFQQSSFQNSQPVNSQPSQNTNFINENSFQTSKQQSNDYFNPGGQNYPFFNPQQTANEVTTESVSSQTNITRESQPVNFNNIKPLSQYNPFEKNEGVPQNLSEITTSTTSQPDNIAFWNQQNQFYNSNPAAVEFFSSPSSFPTDTSAATASETKPSTVPSTTTNTPEPFVDSQRVSQNNDFSSTESTEKPSTSGYRSRIKQRIQPSRYHQVKHTTEKESIDYQLYRSTTKAPSTDYVPETSSAPADTIPQSTDLPETTSKHRRRRPIKPHTQLTVTESTAPSTRGYRTRPNRYQTGSSTERYRARRPTVPVAATGLPETASSEWVGFGGNNLVPSAPAANEITPSSENQPRIADDSQSYSKPATQYWTEPRSQSQSIDAVSNPSTEDSLKTASPVQNTIQEVPSPAWSDGQKSNSFADQQYTAFVPTVQSQQFFIDELQHQNRSEEVVERKDEHQFDNKQVNSGIPQTQIFEETSSTAASVAQRDSIAEGSVYPSEKTVDQEVRKEKFLVKDGVDGQKKAYDPQDEKKVPGRRRGTWVRRIRIKRPQDVLETAESQNLGRLSENSLQTSDSKTLSKTEENPDKGVEQSPLRFRPSPEEPLTTTEASTERLPEVPSPEVSSPEVSSPEVSSLEVSSTESNEYASLQSNFAQMLSDFLNSNDQSTKAVPNRSTENSISFVLGLDRSTESGANLASAWSTSSPPETTAAQDPVTGTSYPVNTEVLEQTTTEEVADTTADKFIGTSTTTEISLETEICYRGKCVKTKKSKASDLLPIE